MNSEWEKSKVSALMYIDLMQDEPEVEIIKNLIISGDEEIKELKTTPE